MNSLRILAATLGMFTFALGFLMAIPAGPQTGQALIIGGAIIIASLLIASAIVETRK
jgi:hypothetical protein